MTPNKIIKLSWSYCSEIAERLPKGQKLSVKLLVLLFTFQFSLSSLNCFSQAAINSSGAPPNSSAMLDVSSSTLGTLIAPRMSTSQMNSIGSPSIGLIIYNTDCNTFKYYNGSSWIAIGITGSLSSPGAPSGTLIPCQGAAGIAYSVNAVPGANGYIWTVPNGSTVASGQGTNSITVNFGNTSGNICVTAYNDCGNSITSCIPITVITAPLAPAPLSADAGTNAITWRWTSVPDATGYQWNSVSTYPGQGVNVTAGNSYYETGLSCNTPYTRYIWAYNSCGHSSSYATVAQTTSSCGTVYCVSSGYPIDYTSSGYIQWYWYDATGASYYSWSDQTSGQSGTANYGSTYINDYISQGCSTYYLSVWAYDYNGNSCGPYTMDGYYCSSSSSGGNFDCPWNDPNNNSGAWDAYNYQSLCCAINWAWFGVSGASYYSFTDYNTGVSVSPLYNNYYYEDNLFYDGNTYHYNVAVWAYDGSGNSCGPITTGWTPQNCACSSSSSGYVECVSYGYPQDYNCSSGYIYWYWNDSYGASYYSWYDQSTGQGSTTGYGSPYAYDYTSYGCADYYLSVWAYDYNGNSCGPYTMSQYSCCSSSSSGYVGCVSYGYPQDYNCSSGYIYWYWNDSYGASYYSWYDQSTGQGSTTGYGSPYAYDYTSYGCADYYLSIWAYDYNGNSCGPYTMSQYSCCSSSSSGMDCSGSWNNGVYYGYPGSNCGVYWYWYPPNGSVAYYSYNDPVSGSSGTTTNTYYDESCISYYYGSYYGCGNLSWAQFSLNVWAFDYSGNSCGPIQCYNVGIYTCSSSSSGSVDCVSWGSWYDYSSSGYIQWYWNDSYGASYYSWYDQTSGQGSTTGYGNPYATDYISQGCQTYYLSIWSYDYNGNSCGPFTMSNYFCSSSGSGGSFDCPWNDPNNNSGAWDASIYQSLCCAINWGWFPVSGASYYSFTDYNSGVSVSPLYNNYYYEDNLFYNGDNYHYNVAVWAYDGSGNSCGPITTGWTPQDCACSSSSSAPSCPGATCTQPCGGFFDNYWWQYQNNGISDGWWPPYYIQPGYPTYTLDIDSYGITWCWNAVSGSCYFSYTSPETGASGTTSCNYYDDRNVCNGINHFIVWQMSSGSQLGPEPIYATINLSGCSNSCSSPSSCGIICDDNCSSSIANPNCFSNGVYYNFQWPGEIWWYWYPPIGATHYYYSDSASGAAGYTNNPWFVEWSLPIGTYDLTVTAYDDYGCSCGPISINNVELTQ
jgi:hypothetical protein